MDRKIEEIIISSSEYPHEGLTEDENKVKEKILKAIYDLTEALIGENEKLVEYDGYTLQQGNLDVSIRNQLRMEQRTKREELFK